MLHEFSGVVELAATPALGECSYIAMLGEHIDF